MSRKTDYSQSEWKMVTDAASLVAVGVSLADWGTISFMKEIAALTKNIKEAQKAHADCELVLDVIEGLGDIGELTLPKLDGDKVSEFVVPRVREALRVIDARASQSERAAYRKFIGWVAQCVADASGEGFLGTGERVSEKERRFLGELQGVLGAL